jgi:hypothetical protein
MDPGLNRPEPLAKSLRPAELSPKRCRQHGITSPDSSEQQPCSAEESLSFNFSSLARFNLFTSGGCVGSCDNQYAPTQAA